MPDPNKPDFDLSKFRLTPPERKPNQIDLSHPLYHKGTYQYRLDIRGNPFGPSIELIFDRIRKRIPICNIESEDEPIGLDSRTINNLRSEGYAYSIRAEVNMDQDIGMVSDPFAASRDVDQVRRIIHMISVHAYEPKTREDARKDLNAMSIYSDILTAICAADKRNYSWSKYLLEQRLKSSDIIEVPQGGFWNFGNSLIECAIIKPNKKPSEENEEDYPLTLREQIEHLLKNVEQKERIDDHKHLDILPVTGPTEKSYAFQLRKAIEGENYEAASRITQDIRRIKEDLGSIDKILPPFTLWVGEKVLIEMAPAGSKYRINQKIGELHVDGFAKVTKMEDLGFDIELLNKGLIAEIHPRILGLVHSLPYVLRFDRFDTDVYVPVTPKPGRYLPKESCVFNAVSE